MAHVIRFGAPLLLALFPVAAGALALLVRARWTRLVTRILILALLFLALARPEVSLQRQDRSTMILLDRSASLLASEDDTETFARIQELVEANPDQDFGLVEFARNADLVYPPGDYRPSLFPRLVDASSTRIRPAVDLALGSMEGGQIVLFSDGRFADDVGIALAKAQAEDVPVHVVPVGSTVAEDLSVSSFTAPRHASVGRPFALRVDVESQNAASARLVIYRDTDLIVADEVTVAPGRSTFALTETLDAEGVVTYRAIIRAEDDPIADNDSLSVTVQSSELPSVLVLDGAGLGIVPSLLDALGISHEVTDRVPATGVLSQYRQLILADVVLSDLTPAEAGRIEHFVRNMGGGLFVIRGERSVAGFGDSQIDDLLPVSASVPEVQQEASLALVFVLDRSASMKGLVHTPSDIGGDTLYYAKIRVLRDATAASASLLPKSTLLGILGFNTAFEWLRPISPMDDVSEVMGILRRLEAGGGTDIFYPLEEAVGALESIEARFKHVLLITDGWTINEPRDYESLYARIAESDNIVVSVIAPDEKPNFELLRAIADAGRGELYHVSEFNDLPATMLNITQRLSRSRFIQEPTEVTGLLADRLAPLEVPLIGGYILTYPRRDAAVHAWAGGDPLFATRNVGLGVVALLNTDLVGAWSDEWIRWQRLSELFGEMFVLSEPSMFTSQGLHASVDVKELHVELLVDARTGEGEFANWLDLETDLLPLEETFELDQVAPGLYRTSFERPASGGYALRLTDRSGGSVVQVPLTIPYPHEYTATGADVEALAAVASLTGGDVLSRDDLLLTEERRFARRAYSPVHLHFLWAAFALLLVELVVLRWPRRRVQLPGTG
jgi:Ca-activated chloride channel family protein